MKKLALIAAMLLFSSYAQAFGLPYAVKSLDTAKTAAAKDSSKHLLVFYTTET